MPKNTFTSTELSAGNSKNVRTHLQAAIYLGDTNEIGVGRLKSFDADHDFGAQHVHGVGAFEPNEIVQLKYAGTLTLDAFAINTNDLVDLGLAGLGKDVLSLGYLTIKIHDPKTGNFIRIYNNCAIQRYRETIAEGQICGENATVLFLSSEKG